MTIRAVGSRPVDGKEAIEEAEEVVLDVVGSSVSAAPVAQTLEVASLVGLTDGDGSVHTLVGGDDVTIGDEVVEGSLLAGIVEAVEGLELCGTVVDVEVVEVVEDEGGADVVVS